MKNSWMLLLALIVVPAWAADAASVPSAGEQSAQGAQTVPKHKAKKHEAKKTEKKAEASTLADTPPDTTGCSKQTCGGVLGCFTRGCAATCSPC